MLRITIELHSARTGKRKILGLMDICNTGKRPYGDSKGDYVGFLYHGASISKVLKRECRAPLRTAELHNFPRKAKPVWQLVAAMLGELYKGKK